MGLLLYLGRHRPHAKRPYEEDVYSEDDSSSSSDGDRHKRRRVESPSLDCADVGAVLTEAAAPGPSTVDSDFMRAASGSELVIHSSASVHPEPAGPAQPSNPATVIGPGASPSVARSRAYNARFAHAVICVCAEHQTVNDAVQQLVGAVRDTAAVVTRLHSQEPVEHQCALLGRMFEFDGFLW